jgi:DNA-binding transcriptional LysR family regulator
MDLNALQLYVAAAEAGSLSEAARRTGVPLPTLSRRVRKLEDELGVRLLERGPQGLALTPTGAQLLTEAVPALASLMQAEQRLYDASGVAGTLRVSLPPHFGPMWSVLSEFRRRHTKVRFDVFVSDRSVDLVADGIDVALRVGDGGYGTYVGRTLTRFRHRVVAAQSLLEHIELEQPADLREHPCACWRTGLPPSWTLGGVQVPLEPMLVTNDYEHLLHMALSGEAITEVPSFIARESLQNGRLIEVLPEHPMPSRSLRALVVDTRAQSPLIRQFLDFAVEAVPAALG